MDVKLLYATRTQHSRKLAGAIGERLGLTPQNLLRDPAPESADLLFVVGGIYGGESMPALLDYLKKLDAAKVRRAALVTSCGGGTQGQASARRILEGKGIEVLGEFICKGSFLFFSLPHPSREDLDRAANFAEKIAAAAGLDEERR
ncbi:MAG TPA: hypothetical protein PLP20_02660 [Oscillospiraceae bacterium]|nr:hypothetical protein [Oscillospiraceae bacterium]HNW04990.1 hypothetical protein [Oscillospiraceae bacterium]HPV99937.1 hypothetical protein [Oscillospiraceae bacterium]